MAIKAKAQWDEDKHEGLSFVGDPGVTKQSFKDECDVNVLVEKYGPKAFDNALGSQPLYGDFTNVPTYEEACKVVMRAEEQFMGLDAKVRRRFDNNPAEFLAFMHSQGNEEEMRQLGLLKAPANVNPTKSVNDVGSLPPSPAVPASGAGIAPGAGAAGGAAQ